MDLKISTFQDNLHTKSWCFGTSDDVSVFISEGSKVGQNNALEIKFNKHVASQGKKILFPVLFFSSYAQVHCLIQIIKDKFSGFPGGAVVESLPANAGDMGLSPGLGRSHMPRSNQAREPQLLSLCSRACAPQQERPRQ